MTFANIRTALCAWRSGAREFEVVKYKEHKKNTPIKFVIGNDDELIFARPGWPIIITREFDQWYKGPILACIEFWETTGSKVERATGVVLEPEFILADMAADELRALADALLATADELDEKNKGGQRG